MSSQAFEQENLVGMVEDLLAIGRFGGVLLGILYPDPWRACQQPCYVCLEGDWL